MGNEIKITGGNIASGVLFISVDVGPGEREELIQQIRHKLGEYVPLKTIETMIGILN